MDRASKINLYLFTKLNSCPKVNAPAMFILIIGCFKAVGGKLALSAATSTITAEDTNCYTLLCSSHLVISEIRIGSGAIAAPPLNYPPIAALPMIPYPPP